MKEYDVYYRRKETFMADKTLKKSDIIKGKTHVFMCGKLGENKDDVFRDMQGEFMAPHIRNQVITIIKKGATNHQSMSVGDAVVELKTGNAYECDMVGWRKVE